MKSHVQLTKSIIKNFTYKCREDNLWKADYIDIKSNSIKTGKAKEVGSIDGFYSDGVENYLHLEVENDFGPILKNIKEFEKLSSISLTPENRDVIRRYCNYLVYRSEYLIKDVNEQSLFSKIIGKVPREYIFSQEFELDELKIFNDYEVNIMMNKTEIQFVVPRNGFYFYKPRGNNNLLRFILPISPHKAIVLIRPSEYAAFFNDETLMPLQVTDNDSVHNLNMLAYQIEHEFNRTIVIGRRQELELILASVDNVT